MANGRWEFAVKRASLVDSETTQAYERDEFAGVDTPTVSQIEVVHYSRWSNENALVTYGQNSVFPSLEKCADRYDQSLITYSEKQ